MSRSQLQRSDRRDRRPALALGSVGVGVAVWVVAVVIGLRRPATEVPLQVTDFLWAISFGAFLSLGAWIARKRPDNPVGWCLAAGPICIGAGVALFEYTGDLGRPAAAWVGLGANPMFDLGLVLLGIWPLWYPDGRMLSWRWRWLLRAVVVVFVASIVTQVLATTPYVEGVPTVSPLAVGSPTIDTVNAALRGTLPLLAIVGFTSLFPRFRRGDAPTRDQLKLLLYAVVLVGGSAGVTMVVGRFVGESPVLEAIGFVLTVASLLCVPTAVAVAIVRHRALDIDRTISRTLSYAVVTAVAVAAYAGSVLLLGGVARAVAGESGDLVVALSTLLVAAVVRPLRRRVQQVVDRRFNRAGVDRQHAAEEFGRRLRDEVDLGTVVADLRTTVAHTLQPASTSVVTVLAASERP